MNSIYDKLLKKVGLPPYKPSEHDILCWLKDYKSYYNLDVIEISMTDKTFNLVGYKDGKTEKLFTEELNDD